MQQELSNRGGALLHRRCFSLGDSSILKIHSLPRMLTARRPVIGCRHRETGCVLAHSESRDVTGDTVMPRSSEGLARLTLLLLCMVAGKGLVMGQVKGTATYRERMALPPNAIFEATLEDVSKADAPAEVIGQ